MPTTHRSPRIRRPLTDNRVVPNNPPLPWCHEAESPPSRIAHTIWRRLLAITAKLECHRGTGSFDPNAHRTRVHTIVRFRPDFGSSVGVRVRNGVGADGYFRAAGEAVRRSWALILAQVSRPQQHSAVSERRPIAGVFTEPETRYLPGRRHHGRADLLVFLPEGIVKSSAEIIRPSGVARSVGGWPTDTDSRTPQPRYPRYSPPRRAGACPEDRASLGLRRLAS